MVYNSNARSLENRPIPMWLLPLGLSPAVEVPRSFTASDVKLTLQYLFSVRGSPQNISSYNGPEFVAKEIQRCLGQASVRTLYINKASPWKNGYVESFNGKLRDELLDRELFLGLDEARYVLDHWRNPYNHRRPHSGIGWQTLLSGLRPSLRLSRRVTSTRFSHSNWYENGEGATCTQTTYVSIHLSLGIITSYGKLLSNDLYILLYTVSRWIATLKRVSAGNRPLAAIWPGTGRLSCTIGTVSCTTRRQRLVQPCEGGYGLKPEPSGRVEYAKCFIDNTDQLQNKSKHAKTLCFILFFVVGGFCQLP